MYQVHGRTTSQLSLRSDYSDHFGCVKSIINEWSRKAVEHFDFAVRLEEAKYINMFLNSVRDLKKGDKLLAVCGDKDWEREDVYDYLNENGAIAERGGLVRRIYYEPENGFEDDELRVIARHMEWDDDSRFDFKICVIRGGRSKEVRDRFKLPRGFGLVLPSIKPPVSMIHFGLINHNRQAHLFNNEDVVRAYQGIFDEMWGKGEPAAVIQPELDSRNIFPHPKLNPPPEKTT